MLFYLTMTILLGFSVALFQYKPWFKSDKIYWVLSVLRALSIAALLLLLFNPKINLNSSQQLANILFDELKLPLVKKRSTSEDVLKILSSYNQIPAYIIKSIANIIAEPLIELGNFI